MIDDLPHPVRHGHTLQGARAAVATKHHKTATIARALGGPGGLRLQTAPVDTDTLGTFTGETPRPDTPRQIATVKAQWACQESGLDIGIGSEGSFFPHPEVGFITMQVEHVAFTQLSTGLIIIGTAAGTAPWTMSRTITKDCNLDGLGDVLSSGLQRLIVRPDTSPIAERGITKGIATTDHLRTAVNDAIRHSRMDARLSKPTYAPTTAHHDTTAFTPQPRTSPTGSRASRWSQPCLEVAAETEILPRGRRHHRLEFRAMGRRRRVARQRGARGNPVGATCAAKGLALRRQSIRRATMSRSTCTQARSTCSA